MNETQPDAVIVLPKDFDATDLQALIAPGANQASQSYTMCEDERRLAKLYGEIQETGAVTAMLWAIDASEEHIKTEDITYLDEVENAEKITRLTDLLFNMPTEDVAAKERVRAWDYLLDKQWVYEHGDPFTLDTVLLELKESDTTLTEYIDGLIDKADGFFAATRLPEENETPALTRERVQANGAAAIAFATQATTQELAT